MTMLWPDSDAMHARNSLRQELFQINRDLGVQPLHQDPETIRIEPDIVDVDIWKFDAAIAGNQHEAASALYGGPFMDAFYIEGADELDRWIDLQRARMRADVMRAMDAVAEQCCKHGDIRGMVLWRRRLTQLEPLSSSIALDLLRTLVAAEDRSAALKHAREHEFFVRKHLDSPPDPAFSAYVRTLRR